MTISEALRAAARYVEEHKAILVRSGPGMLSEAERARAGAEVSALGHDLDGLAAASETARVYPREYEAIRRELQARGFFVPPEITRAIADAFQAVAKVPGPLTVKPEDGKDPAVRLRKADEPKANEG